MYGDLLVRKKDGQSLDSFVASLSAIIGCSRWEQRESSDYVEERYYRCTVLGLEVIAAIADDSEFTDYDFHLCLQPHGVVVDDKAFLAGLADCVARTLAIGGHEVLRPLDIGHSGNGAVLYRRNPAGGARLRERVLTQEI